MVVSAKPVFFAGAIFGSVAGQRPADESGAQPSEPANGEMATARMPDGAQATGDGKAKAHAGIDWMRWCRRAEQDDEALGGAAQTSSRCEGKRPVRQSRFGESERSGAKMTRCR